MTETDLALAWMRAFALTLVTELAVAVPLFSRYLPSLPKRLTLVTFAQLSTHPIVWFVLPLLHLPRGPFLVTAETWAWLAETVLYTLAVPALPTRQALVVSLAANAVSLVVGISLRALGAPV